MQTTIARAHPMVALSLFVSKVRPLSPKGPEALTLPSASVHVRQLNCRPTTLYYTGEAE
jgi:hypothetical protein